MITSLPIAFVDGFFLLLTYVDILNPADVRRPGRHRGVLRATKTLAMLNFIYFAVSAASAHRFAQYYVAGEHDKLASFLKDAVRWTFWPSLVFGLALLALGEPILSLFAPASPTAIADVRADRRLIARASVGPAERLLSMQDQQMATR